MECWCQQMSEDPQTSAKLVITANPVNEHKFAGELGFLIVLPH